MNLYEVLFAKKLNGGGGGGGYTINDIIERTDIVGDVVYDGTVTNLPNGALSKTNITSFTSSKITNNEDGNAFFGCPGLKTVSLPNLEPINTISCGSMFKNCTALESIYIPKFKRSAGNIFQGCTHLKMLVLPSVNYALQGYFANGCTALTTVDLGASLASGNAFAGNAFSSSGLNTLILRGTGSVLGAQNASNFNGTPLASNGSGGTIYVPSALLSSYQSATIWSSLNATWLSIEGSYYETHYADGSTIGA